MDNNQKFEYVESDIITQDFSGRRGVKTTISDVSVKKRVLLVCVHNKKGTLITHDIIYKLFMNYGEIYKILIFDKCKNWKIFVEMATLDQAEKARDGLNNYQLFNDGSKMTVYYAKNNNSGGVDYRELKQRLNNQNNVFQNSGTFNSSQNLSTPGLLNSPNLNSITGNIKKQLPVHSLQRKSDFNRQIENSNSTEKQRNNSLDELYRKFESFPNIRVSPQHNHVSGVSQKNSLFQNIQPLQVIGGLNGDISGEAQIGVNGHSNNDISQGENNEGNNINQLSSEFKKMNINNNSDNLDSSSIRSDGSHHQSEKDEDNQDASGVINMKNNNEFKSGNNTSNISSNNFNNENGSNNFIMQNENQGGIQKQNVNFQQGGNFPYYNNQENQMNFNNQAQNHQFSGLSEFNKNFQIDDDDDYDDEIQQIGEDLVGQQNEELNSNNNRNNRQRESSDMDPSNYVNPLYILENKKSKVIYVRGLEKKNLTTKKIYNLFSNFGNIELILYFTEKRYCLIQFETQEDATVAKDHLDLLKVESNQMRIFYSNYETIKENQEGEKFCEIWKGEKNHFRFRTGKQISINPVTSTLHVSNLRQETCKQDVMFEKFSPYGTIEAFHPLPNVNKFMCHVKFSNIEDAINALTNLHEEEICGRKMHISFTRTRVSPQVTPDQQNSGLVNNNQPHNYSNFHRFQNNMPQFPYNQYDSHNTGILSTNNPPNNFNSKKNRNIDTNQEVNQSVKVLLLDEEDDNYNQDMEKQNNGIQQQYWYNYQNYPDYANPQNMGYQPYIPPHPQYVVQNGQIPYSGQQMNQFAQNQYPQQNNQNQRFPNQQQATRNMQQNNNYTLFK